MSLPRGTVFVRTVTATSDIAFPIVSSGSEEGNIILSSINIHCYTNPAYYGNGAFQVGQIMPNAVVWFDGHIRVSDLWFKNYTAGSNTVITVVGIVE